MSDKSKEFYKKLGDIDDEYIESADNVEKYKKTSKYKKNVKSENVESDSVVVFDNGSGNFKKILYVAAVLIIATIVGFIIKNNLFGKDEHVGDEDKNSPTPSATATNIPDVDFSDFGQSEYPASSVYEEIDGTKISDGYAVSMEPNVNYVFDFDKDGKDELMCYTVQSTSRGCIGTLYMNNVVVYNFDDFGGKAGIVDLYSDDEIYDFYYANGLNEDYYRYGSCPLNNFNDTSSPLDYKYTSNVADISKWRFNVNGTPGLTDVYQYEDIEGIAGMFINQKIQISINEEEDNKGYYYKTKYLLKDGEEYEILKYYTQPSKLIKDMEVYSKPDDTSSTLTIKAQNVEYKKVVIHQKNFDINGDCNYGYIYLEAEDGSSGWMQFKEDIEDGMVCSENMDAYNASSGRFDYSINGEMSSKYFIDYSRPE